MQIVRGVTSYPQSLFMDGKIPCKFSNLLQDRNDNSMFLILIGYSCIKIRVLLLLFLLLLLLPS